MSCHHQNPLSNPENEEHRKTKQQSKTGLIFHTHAHIRIKIEIWNATEVSFRMRQSGPKVISQFF